MTDDSVTTSTNDQTPRSAPEPAMNGSTIARIAVRTTVWVGLGSYATQIIGFVATIAITRILSPEVFGIFSLATFWFTLLNLRTKSGINYAAIRQSENNGELLGTYLVLDAAATVISIGLSVITGFILTQLKIDPVVAVALIVLVVADGFSTVVSPLNLILEKELQVSRLTLVTIISAVIAYSLAIILALKGAGIISLLAINVSTSITNLIGIYVVCRRRWPQAFHIRWKFDRTLGKRLVKEGLPTGLSLTALSSIVTQFDNFLIGTFVGFTTLGFYDRAYRIAGWPNLLMTTIMVRIGFLTFNKVRDDPPRLTHAVRLSLWVLLTLGLPIALGLFFGADDIIKILYTDKYNESAYFLHFLAVYTLVWPFVSIGFWLSVALGHHRHTVLFTVAQAASLILIGTPLTLAWGANGTLAAVAITMLLALSLSLRYIFQHVTLSLRKVFGAHLVAILIAATALGLLQLWPGLSLLAPFIRLALIGLVGTSIFALVLLGLRRAEILERLRYIWRVFPAGQRTD